MVAVLVVVFAPEVFGILIGHAIDLVIGGSLKLLTKAIDMNAPVAPLVRLIGIALFLTVTYLVVTQFM